MLFKNRCGSQPQAPPNYKLHEQVGSGQFSTVHRCTHLPTSQVYAIKCIPKYHFQQIPQLFALLQTELRLLRQLSHPNVIKLIDSYEDSRMFYIIYEYCPDGTLHSLFSKNRIGKIPSAVAIDYFKQIVSALACLHQHSLLHRDIKPANILLCQNGKTTKLSDFGFCKQTNNLTHTQLGTPGYMAPEMLNGHSYDQKADVYSLGVCLQQLISNSQRDPSLDSYAQIAQKMIQRDPRARPTIQQVNQMLSNNNNNNNQINKKENEGQIKKNRSRSQPCYQIPQQCYQQQMQQQLNNQVYIKQNQNEIERKKLQCNYYKKATESPQQRYQYNCNKNNYPPKYNYQQEKNQKPFKLSPKQLHNNNNKENDFPQCNIHKKPRNQEDYQNNNFRNQNCVNKKCPVFQQENEKKYQELQPVSRKQQHYDINYLRQKYQNHRKYR